MKKMKVRVFSFLLAFMLLLSFSYSPIKADAYTAKYMTKSAKNNINSYVKSMKIVAQNNKNTKNKTYKIDKFKTKYTVIIFGRTRCGNCMSTLREVERLREEGKSIKVVFMDVDSYDSGLYSLRKQYPKIITSSNGTYNNRYMWDLVRHAEFYRNSITLPVTFVFNKKHKIKYWNYSQDLYGLRDALK